MALVGTRVWRIFCIVSHWKSPKNGPANDDHAGAVPALTDMCFTWQKDSQHVWSRVLWLVALAPTGFVGLILAAGYLPRVSTLVSVKFCCPAATAHFFWQQSQHEHLEHHRRPHNIAGCDGYRKLRPSVLQPLSAPHNSVPGHAGCSSSYVRKQIPPAIVDTNASCPFDPKICKGPSGNLLIDTGLLDSLDDFGRNSPPTQRLKIRRTLE